VTQVATDLIDAFLEAMTTYDTDTLRSLCSPDLRHWLSVSGEEQGLDHVLATIAKEREVVDDATFVVRRRVETVEGVVLMLTVDGRTRGGAAFHIPVCLVIGVDHDKIVRLDEYANLDGAQELIREMFA
jgi:ketosteroid isomerase-like protein